MLKTTGIFCSVLATLMSIAVFAAAGWLWHRSMRIGDLVVRMEPAPHNQSRMRGVGSYRGAVLIGYLVDPKPIEGKTRFQHEVIPVFEKSKSGGSLLEVVPTYKTGGLGFGTSDGQLRMMLPAPLLMFMAPPSRVYHVVYVPYYFLMVLALVQPLRVALKSALPRRRPVERVDLSTVLV